MADVVALPAAGAARQRGTTTQLPRSRVRGMQRRPSASIPTTIERGAGADRCAHRSAPMVNMLVALPTDRPADANQALRTYAPQLARFAVLYPTSQAARRCAGVP